MENPKDFLLQFKLEAEVQPDRTLQTSWHSDRSRGIRREKIVQEWRRVNDSPIGSGGNGVVWLEKNNNGQLRAVKEVKRSGNITSYLRELLASAKLASKNEGLFVHLFGWFESDHSIYLAMEYIPSGDLEQCYKRALPEAKVKSIASQLLEGLVKMHEMGFAHRDLKPQNIFVVQEDPIWVKIGDFGISKRIASNTSSLRTPIGTREFAAPEVQHFIVDDQRQIDAYTEAVDIWSLGCVLYYLLTRSLPFPSTRKLMDYCSTEDVLNSFPHTALKAIKLSDDGERFLRKVLMPRPSDRGTACFALTHTWLNPDRETLRPQSARRGWTDWIMQDPVQEACDAVSVTFQTQKVQADDLELVERPASEGYPVLDEKLVNAFTGDTVGNQVNPVTVIGVNAKRNVNIPPAPAAKLKDGRLLNSPGMNDPLQAHIGIHSARLQALEAEMARWRMSSHEQWGAIVGQDNCAADDGLARSGSAPAVMDPVAVIADIVQKPSSNAADMIDNVESSEVGVEHPIDDGHGSASCSEPPKELAFEPRIPQGQLSRRSLDAAPSGLDQNHHATTLEAALPRRETTFDVDDFAERLEVLPASKLGLIICDHCSKPVGRDHYHCDICYDNDFDLCMPCIYADKYCQDRAHTLRMRTIVQKPNHSEHVSWSRKFRGFMKLSKDDLATYSIKRPEIRDRRGGFSYPSGKNGLSPEIVHNEDYDKDLLAALALSLSEAEEQAKRKRANPRISKAECVQNFAINKTQGEAGGEVYDVPKKGAGVHQGPPTSSLENSITIHRVKTGERYSVTYNPDLSVSDLKAEIEKLVAVPPQQQSLYCGANRQELTDGKTLSELGIWEGETIKLMVLSLSGASIAVKVRMLTGQSFTLHFKPRATIQAMLEKIESSEGIPVAMQQLYFQGKVLDPTDAFLGAGIRDKSTVYVALLHSDMSDMYDQIKRSGTHAVSQPPSQEQRKDAMEDDCKAKENPERTDAGEGLYESELIPKLPEILDSIGDKSWMLDLYPMLARNDSASVSS